MKRSLGTATILTKKEKEKKDNVKELTQTKIK